MQAIIAGVDEVGYGPLAGPIIAAAVILNPRQPIYKLRDSKLLTAAAREKIFARIYAKALAVSVGRAEVTEIDTLNIYHANMLTMQRAIEGLKIKPDEVLIDGKAKPKLELNIKTIVDGDQLIPCISAASIR